MVSQTFIWEVMVGQEYKWLVSTNILGIMVIQDVYLEDNGQIEMVEQTII